MNIEIKLHDINGNPINIGDRVLVYEQRYAEFSRDESGPVTVICLDQTRPKPIVDAPLVSGIVIWSPTELAVEIKVDKYFQNWQTKPSHIKAGGGCYAFELID